MGEVARPIDVQVHLVYSCHIKQTVKGKIVVIFYSSV